MDERTGLDLDELLHGPWILLIATLGYAAAFSSLREPHKKA
jgi:hypothetical protein